jgi:hypothetical protein
MKVFVKGVGEIEVDETKHFIAKGGEGSIFGKGGTVYKIYEDASKMISPAKIKELAVLDHPEIIKPENLILDSKSKVIGYTMKYIKNALALCRIFTKTYRQANKITPDMMLELTKKFQEMIKFIHSKKILVVDLNEFNFLVDASIKHMYAIDVNSYQTPSFPATAIMPSVKDHHCNNHFTEGTDWFSWGVVACQILLGIHPYKHGGYQPFENLPLDQRMEARMKGNVSIFNPKVKIPAVAQPFAVIPSALKSWMIAVLEKGERVAPPDNYVMAVQIAAVVKNITGSNLFDIDALLSLDEAINKIVYHEGTRVIFTDDSVFVDKRQLKFNKPNAHVGFTAKYHKPILGWIEGGTVQLFDVLDSQPLLLNLQAANIMSCGGRLYVQNDTGILEVNLKEVSNSIIPTTKLVGRVMDIPGATMVLDGFVIQSILGRQVVSLFPDTGLCYQVNIAELDGYKIIDGKYENRVLVIVGAKHGRYSRFVFRMADDYQTYDCRKVDNVAYTDLNFTVNEAGICTLMAEDEKMEAFSNKVNSAGLKVLDDPILTSDMRLTHDGTKIVFSKDKKIYGISIKKKP